MSLNQPTPPDPYATAAAQEQMNTKAAEQQQQINDVNQVTPYGNLTYTQTGVGKDGIPIEQSNLTLSPAEQGLLNSTLGTQQTIAGDAGQLAKSLNTSLTQAPNLSNDSLVNTMMGWQQKYMQPIFDQQQSNLNSKLAAQGITQGSDAYDNAQNLQARNQDNAYEGALAADEGQAYNQALGKYEAPIQTLGTLLGEGSPTSINQNLVNTPQEQIQPANLESLVSQNYQNQMQQYGNTMSGLFSIPSAILGGWAKMGFPTSDRRAKRDILRVGWLDDGTPIYRFRYIKGGDPVMHIGVMAQDILHDRPDAVLTGEDGMFMVDYEKATDNAVRCAHG
jgi:hypothetical protein